jgi:hypothetical protein
MIRMDIQIREMKPVIMMILLMEMM